jgi:hypothetical protein
MRDLQTALVAARRIARLQPLQGRGRVCQHDVERPVADGAGDQGDEFALIRDQVAGPRMDAEHAQVQVAPGESFG